MASTSQVITVDLADNSGKIVPFYTYDGYLEEADRIKIRNTFQSLDHLRWSATAVFGFAGFAVYCSLSSGHSQTHAPHPQSQRSIHPRCRIIFRITCSRSGLRPLHLLQME